jgi:hypothetical protein
VEARYPTPNEKRMRSRPCTMSSPSIGVLR